MIQKRIYYTTGVQSLCACSWPPKYALLPRGQSHADVKTIHWQPTVIQKLSRKGTTIPKSSQEFVSGHVGYPERMWMSLAVEMHVETAMTTSRRNLSEIGKYRRMAAAEKARRWQILTFAFAPMRGFLRRRGTPGTSVSPHHVRERLCIDTAWPGKSRKTNLQAKTDQPTQLHGPPGLLKGANWVVSREASSSLGQPAASVYGDWREDNSKLFPQGVKFSLCLSDWLEDEIHPDWEHMTKALQRMMDTCPLGKAKNEKILPFVKGTTTGTHYIPVKKSFIQSTAVPTAHPNPAMDFPDPLGLWHKANVAPIFPPVQGLEGEFLTPYDLEAQLMEGMVVAVTVAFVSWEVPGGDEGKHIAHTVQLEAVKFGVYVCLTCTL
ncbi:hypothetical protein DFS34DRAFT_593645 [Phlyctochytrium arcticum]|nr:hypothetical protein DFS34DRAFT_593645 [Phlyctochytrium arcticum]